MDSIKFLLCFWVAVSHGACLAQGLASRQLVEWTSGSATGSARALVLLEVSETDHVQLVLLEAPGGRRMVLRDVVHGPEGVLLQRLEDDQTGWWVDVEQDFQFEARDLKDFYDRGVAHLQGKGKGRLLVTLRTAGGLLSSAEVTDSGTSSALDDFLRYMEEAGLAAKLAAEMPAELAGPAAFVGSWGMATGDGAPGQALAQLGDLLASVRRSAGSGGTEAVAAAGPWVARVEDRAVGTAPLEGAALSFARSFRSIPAEDPLVGWHAADLRTRANRPEAAARR